MEGNRVEDGKKGRQWRKKRVRGGLKEKVKNG